MASRLLSAGRPVVVRQSLLASNVTRKTAAMMAASRDFTSSVGFKGLQYDTLVEMQQRACERYADQKFLGQRPQGQKHFQWITFKEFGHKVEQAKVVLKHAGVGPGDVVGMISSNRPEWAVAAYGIYSLGAVLVPMYEQQRLKECEYIISDSKHKLLLVSKERIYDEVKILLGGSMPNLKDIYCFDMDWESRLGVIGEHEFIPSHPVEPDDLATIIYTSGTTGKPKGVELSHRNFTTNIKGIASSVPDDAISPMRSVAFLPWAHCFGQTCELHNSVQRGAELATVDDLAALSSALQEVKPTVLYSVPTLYKRVYDGIQAKLAEKQGVGKWLIDKALTVAETRKNHRSKGETVPTMLELQHTILDKIVLSKLRAPLGGEIQGSFIGGSALPIEVGNFFENLGLNMCEGYGLSETSPLISVGTWDIAQRQQGTVGKPIWESDVRIVKDGVEVPLGEEGEVWVAGPFVFRGYHNLPEETANAFGTLHGKQYFKTGDLGTMVNNGQLLKITGRVKELYKLENGKYVVPGLIEKAMAANELFTQVMVTGSNKPYNIAIIAPNWDKLFAWAHANAENIGQITNKEQVVSHPQVQAFLEQEVVTACEGKIKKYEIPSRLLLLETPLSIENEMLTPKLSIKRHIVMKHYGPAVEKLYSDKSGSKVHMA